MIKKMTNKNENFYNYMGEFFGSRSIEKELSDRIYDDDEKEWYLYIKEEKVRAFVSVNKSVIKNVYATEDKYLKKVLEEVKKKEKIRESIVSKKYTETYQKSGYTIDLAQCYKNFVVIHT